MKKLMTFAIASGMAVLMASNAYARDTRHLLPIHAAVNTQAAQQKLDGTVKFFFASQSHPQVLQDLGSYVGNRKTNAFAKSDEDACNWAFLSALVALQDHAKKVGANAVVDIVSYYRKSEMSSNAAYECHAGATVAGVALKGEFVRIATK